MDGRFSNPFVTESEDSGFMLDITDSPPSFSREDKLNHHNPSTKRSKRSLQKRVVSVPIRDGDGSRVKGEGAPPSDSWAWRKYGQKPIKGSPYPRGYYRCSSSKGCPARKQVERSRVDPNMLVITYACDHNHSWPASKAPNSTPTTRSEPTKTPTREPKILPTQTRPEPKLEPKSEPELEPETHYSDLVEDPLITPDDFSWFADVSSTSPTVLESPIYTESSPDDIDMAMIFSVREEDESLFADLGELPECSVVFRRGYIKKEAELRRCNLRNSLCESTG